MYQKMLEPIEKDKKRSKILTAMALGVNQLIMFSVVACLFWAGAVIIVHYKGEVNS